MQDYELDAYLGDTEATAEQRERMLAAADLIEQRWPEPHLADTRREAFTAAVQVILGDDTTEAHADRWVSARAREREAMAALTGALIADERGDAQAARAAGVNRMTVRLARGK